MDRRTGRREALALAALVVALAALPPLLAALGQPFYIRVATRILVFALAASSLNLVLGFGGLVSLGHAAFVGLGAYVVAILAWHDANDVPLIEWPVAVGGTLDALVAWPLAIGAAALAAGVIGAISLRTSGLSFIMITLAFAQMIYFYATSLDRYGGDDGLRMRGRSLLPPLDLSDRTTLYYVVLASLAGTLALLFVITRSRFGLLVGAMRQNDLRVRAIGFRPYPYRLACFTLSGALAGLAGVLLVNLDGFVSPADLSLARSNELVAMILIGGVGGLWGPLVGAGAYLLLELGLGTLTTHWPLIFGPMLIALVLFARRGLVGLVSGART